MLDGHGYEPLPDEHGLTPVTCPFHALAQSCAELVCGLNVALIDGPLAACVGLTSAYAGGFPVAPFTVRL